MSWCTTWKCQSCLPVFASIATMLLLKRLFPSLSPL